MLRLWTCPACGRTVRAGGNVTARICDCKDQAIMKYADAPPYPQADVSPFVTYMTPEMQQDDDDGTDLPLPDPESLIMPTEEPTGRRQRAGRPLRDAWQEPTETTDEPAVGDTDTDTERSVSDRSEESDSVSASTATGESTEPAEKSGSGKRRSRRRRRRGRRGNRGGEPQANAATESQETAAPKGPYAAPPNSGETVDAGSGSGPEADKGADTAADSAEKSETRSGPRRRRRRRRRGARKKSGTDSGSGQSDTGSDSSGGAET